MDANLCLANTLRVAVKDVLSFAKTGSDKKSHEI